mmetsp:Transcript_31504/g.27889  ORF Transcript_31504/g.27889 Transcript_31504/m.27889 type:complete len:121 (-) Transcript_31504:1327-1689(-)
MIKRHETSGNIYYFGRVYNAQKSIFMQFDSTDNPQWFKIYDLTACLYAFDLTSDESFLYSASFSGTNLTIFQQNALDGGVSNGKITSDFYTDDATKLIVSADNSVVYISVLSTAGNLPSV